MRVLCDANIFISFLLYPQKPGPINEIITAVFRGALVLILPEALLDEFVSKIPDKPYLVERINPDELKAFGELLHEIGEVIPLIEDEIPAVTEIRRMTISWLMRWSAQQII